jgi:ABC-type branched-subunit amino acid transport system permease subunit
MAVDVETPRRAAETEPPAPSAVAGSGRRARLIGLGLLGLVALLPIPFGDFGFFAGQYALVYAMLGLSVTVVTGYAGLISLMPYSFAGIGAMITGLAMASWGWPFWLAVLLGAAATIPFSVLVGVASIRLKGLYLAIATLTMANALGETFFQWGDVTGGNTGWLIERPRLGPVDFASDRMFYVLCLGVVLLLLWMVEGLRTSRVGRAMLAVRDNELEAQALGINVYKTKLVALVIGGMIAAIGGGFLAALLLSPSPSAFRPPFAEVTSIVLITLVAIGGIDRALGAFFGAIALVIQQQVFQGAEFFFAFFGIYTGITLILFLMFRPGGLMQIGKLQLELIRRRPVLGIAVAAAVVGVNVGIAWLVLSLS